MRRQFTSPSQVRALTTIAQRKEKIYSPLNHWKKFLLLMSLLANSNPTYLQENKKCKSKHCCMLKAASHPSLFLFFCCFTLCIIASRCFLTCSFNTQSEVMMSQHLPPLAHVMYPTANNAFPLLRIQWQLQHSGQNRKSASHYIIVHYFFFTVRICHFIIVIFKIFYPEYFYLLSNLLSLYLKLI